MKVEFPVEAESSHRVNFSFDKLLHGLVIELDGAPVAHEVRRFSASGWDVRHYAFKVGTTTVRQVILELWSPAGLLSPGSSERKVLLPGLHPQPLRAFVDGKLVATSDHQPPGAPPRPLGS